MAVFGRFFSRLRNAAGSFRPAMGSLEAVMASGGRRARSGPTPDLEAFARERDKGEWVLLPMSWKHRAPRWPLDNPVDPVTKLPAYRHERESKIWTQLWNQGQAPAWIMDKQEFSVALYVRLLVMVESTMSTKSAPLLAELRRQQEMLGLSTDGLLKNKWRFKDHDGMSVAAAEKAAASKPAGKTATVTDLFAGVKVRGA